MRASALLLARLRHGFLARLRPDAERVSRARMASPTPPAGMRGHASRAAVIQGSPWGMSGAGRAAVKRLGR